jgi:hypothetical protein
MARKLGQYFIGQFFKASDFPSPRLLTIAAVDEQEIGQKREKRLIVKFEGEEQSLVVNKTNALSIAEITGTDDVDEWIGAKIVLYAAKTDFAGRQVDCIRVRAPRNQSAKPTNPPAAVEAAQHQLQQDASQSSDESFDDVPF